MLSLLLASILIVNPTLKPKEHIKECFMLVEYQHGARWTLGFVIGGDKHLEYTMEWFEQVVKNPEEKFVFPCDQLSKWQGGRQQCFNVACLKETK